jgi:hypothetical protein
MMQGVFSTPRPVPGRLAPAVAGATVILLGLPVFLTAGFPLSGWSLAAVLFVAGQALSLVLTQLLRNSGTLAAVGVAGIGMSFRAMAVGIPLVIVTATNVRVGLSAALLYALAYTLELAVSLLTYFSGGTGEAR